MKYLYLILFFLIFYIPFSTQAVVENRGLSFQPITTIVTDTSITPNIADYKMPRMKEKPFSVFDTYSKRMILYPVILVILQIAFVGMFSIGAEAFGISRIIKMLSVALGSIVPFYLTRLLVRNYYSQHKKPKQGREPIATRTYNRLAVLLFALFALLTVTQFSAVRFSPLLFAGATFIGSSSDTIQAVENIKRKVKRDKKIVPEVVTEQKEIVAVNVTEQKEVVVVKEIPKVEIKDTIAKIIELPKPVVEKEPKVAPIIIEPKLILLERAGNFGFKDLDGNTVITPKYSIAYEFREGFAQVQLDNKWGFINKKGEIICPIKYDDCNAFREGMAVVRTNGKYGYINQQGKLVFPCIYDSASDFQDGQARVELKGQMEVIVLKRDEKTKPIVVEKITAPTPASVSIPEPELRLIERSGKFGFKDLDGNTVILPKYTIAYDFSEGLAQVQLDNKWGFINKKGVVICPIQYDDCNAFSEGLAVVQKNGVYGYINKDGKIRILPQYSSASNFREGSANVEKDGRKFRINVQGKEW
jgi:hypothetical protein